MFNEKTLLEEIERVWGKHGAHAEVYRDMLKKVDQHKIANPTKSSTEECVHPYATFLEEKCRLHIVTNAIRS